MAINIPRDLSSSALLVSSLDNLDTPKPGSSVKIVAESIADGPVATKGSHIKYSARLYLRRGEEVTPDYQSIARYSDRIPTRTVEGVTLIEHATTLGQRHSIAGIEQALLGLSAGSYREVVIPPHLGYGEKGLGGMIPPNAILRARVWLHEIKVDTDN